jgi:hypothetical protein
MFVPPSTVLSVMWDNLLASLSCYQQYLLATLFTHEFII